eukprot:GDKJ01024093.1.p1 GENE.GDKJ01024093.1~~GDKJ01024093.1.p1  ORF type:complete len:731 (+),score=155.77 GDKJ01024093.1:252-2195(+)
MVKDLERDNYFLNQKLFTFKEEPRRTRKQQIQFSTPPQVSSVASNSSQTPNTQMSVRKNSIIPPNFAVNVSPHTRLPPASPPPRCYQPTFSAMSTPVLSNLDVQIYSPQVPPPPRTRTNKSLSLDNLSMTSLNPEQLPHHPSSKNRPFMNSSTSSSSSNPNQLLSLSLSTTQQQPHLQQQQKPSLQPFASPQKPFPDLMNNNHNDNSNYNNTSNNNIDLEILQNRSSPHPPLASPRKNPKSFPSSASLPPPLSSTGVLSPLSSTALPPLQPSPYALCTPLVVVGHKHVIENKKSPRALTQQQQHLLQQQQQSVPSSSALNLNSASNSNRISTVEPTHTTFQGGVSSSDLFAGSKANATQVISSTNHRASPISHLFPINYVSKHSNAELALDPLQSLHSSNFSPSPTCLSKNGTLNLYHNSELGITQNSYLLKTNTTVIKNDESLNTSSNEHESEGPHRVATTLPHSSILPSSATHTLNDETLYATSLPSETLHLSMTQASTHAVLLENLEVSPSSTMINNTVSNAQPQKKKILSLPQENNNEGLNFDSHHHHQSSVDHAIPKNRKTGRVPNSSISTTPPNDISMPIEKISNGVPKIGGRTTPTTTPHMQKLPSLRSPPQPVSDLACLSLSPPMSPTLNSGQDFLMKE